MCSVSLAYLTKHFVVKLNSTLEIIHECGVALDR